MLKDLILSIYLSACIYLSICLSIFTNERILDTLCIQRVFVGYIFIVRCTLLGTGFNDKDY